MKTIRVTIDGIDIDITQNEDGTYNKPDIVKQWETHGSTLKPAFEPIIVAMKPLDGTYAENALKYGVAGLNIDGSRIETTGSDKEQHLKEWDRFQSKAAETSVAMGAGLKDIRLDGYAKDGRFPANIILDEDSAALLDEQSGELKISGAAKNNRPVLNHDAKNQIFNGLSKRNGVLHNDKGGASRFFYVAKASRSERDKGLDDVESSKGIRSNAPRSDEDVKTQSRTNNHPTVKPIKLLEYLCTLTKTPTSGIILDPFMGSGSLGIAALNTGREYIGIEIDEGYYKIAEKRIESWKKELQQEKLV